jgi:hypothetical protein
MMLKQFDNYMDDNNVIITIKLSHVTESDRRLLNKVFQLLYRFKRDLEEICEDVRLRKM